MEFLKGLGIVGFLFFFFKGMAWIVLFLLVYYGFISKEKLTQLKEKFSFKKRNKDKS